jgi:LacI family transcriptional regulator
MGKIRIKDIAAFANVSIGTVDRVIHNRGEVSEATRARVKKLLEQYNYQPDLIASSLAQKRETRLAVVMPRLVNEHVFWNLPQEGVRKAMEALENYNLAVDSYYFNQFDASDFLRLLKNFPFERTQGVLFAPVFQEESIRFLRRCEQMGIPVVLFNSWLEGNAVRSYVGQDAYQSGYVAAKLVNYGMEPRKDVAIVNLSSRPDHYPHIISREEGFRAYFEEHSDRLDHLVTVHLNGAEDLELYERLDQLFNRHDLAGIFVTNSRVYKVAAYLAEHGIMNIRLVGYDLLPESIGFLKRDYIDFLISQQPELQAFKGLHSLFYLVVFHREPERRQLLPIDIITRENLEYYINQ